MTFIIAGPAPRTGLLLPGGALCVAAGQDGLAVAGSKLSLCAQEARHEEVKQRPQLQHVVLGVAEGKEKKT